ncbi:molybdate ABC transporter substrate-binding protein [Micromonospora auratinigra]|uniref:molybdate ABC transporter substrate-binding protein n=1 Tax=Micromonospora auratinigra TaxID=261654 RepID=UPI0018D39022|nr:molybdate ABC transporter substrate-binding protein [Micromonospora auratinigra]
MRAALAATAALALALTGCGGGDGPVRTDGGRITVFAAASLTESFTKLGRDFRAAHPGSAVTFNFAGSSALATQLVQGAPADVFAAASPATMKTVTDAGEAAGTPATLARNQLVIAVPKGNPGRVTGPADLARLKVALCAAQVPCGAAARTALDAAGVRLTPATLEQDVKGALAKLRLGEVDAALVYRTDVRAAAGDLDAVEFPESARAVNDYPIVVLKRAGDPATARAFVDFVRGEAGRSVLTAAGFQPPPA